jgi:hypothetical protein
MNEGGANVRRRLTVSCFLFLLGATRLGAGDPILVVTDPEGAAARVGAPASVAIDLAAVFGRAVDAKRLRLVEEGREGESGPAVQFVPDAQGSTKGTLWWLMPAGPQGERRFRLAADGPAAPALIAKFDEKAKAVDVRDGALPVLRYNQGTVPPPPEIVEHYERKKDPPEYYARGDYIHPIHGPDGEIVTDDYSLDHPHHRGLCWAWPVVRWKGESRDIWAVRVLPSEPGGVWARPVSLDRLAPGAVLAAIDATNVWKWGDREEIVREKVAIRAFRQQDRRRYLDVELRFEALVDDLSIGGRPNAGYGGFTFRTYPEFDGRHVAMHVDPPESSPRRVWFHLTGNFPGGKGPAGVALLEHVTNPDYPTWPDPQNADRVAGQYPRWRSVQPAWPGDREVALRKGEPLVLKHRLWIHPGRVDEATLADVWAAYAEPPAVRVKKAAAD